jgi:hypothetical protein
MAYLPRGIGIGRKTVESTILPEVELGSRGKSDVGERPTRLCPKIHVGGVSDADSALPTATRDGSQRLIAVRDRSHNYF